MQTVRLNLIKVYEIEVPDSYAPLAAAYSMQTTAIERNGKLLDASTDFAEVVVDDGTPGLAAAEAQLDAETNNPGL